MQIEIKSRPIRLLFGYSAYKTLMNGVFKMKDKYMDEQGNFTAYGLAKLIYSAYENYCLDKDISADIRFDDVLEWVDQSSVTNAGKEQLKDIIDEWSASVHIKKMVDEQQKKSEEQRPESQSQLTLTGLNPSVTESSLSDPGNSEE